MNGLERLYPGKGDPPGEPLPYKGSVVEVKVGNVPIADWVAMDKPIEGIPRSATNVLAGVAIDESGEVVDCVLLPPDNDAAGEIYKIDWAVRLATAQELFKAQHSKTESIA